MKRRNLLAAVLSFSLVIGMSAPVDLAQESKKTQTAVSIEDSVGDTSKYGYLPRVIDEYQRSGRNGYVLDHVCDGSV